MSPSSPLLPPAILALFAATLSCAPLHREESVAVPAVASIPVAPLTQANGAQGPARAPASAAAAPLTPAVATPNPTPTPTPNPPPTANPTPNQPPTAPDSPPTSSLEPLSDPPSPARVVLADEVPFRFLLHPRPDNASAAPDHVRTHSHRRGKTGNSSRPYHPAPGIVINVSDAEGGPAAAEWQRTARNAGYWPVRRCYEEGLRRDQTLSGRVLLDLSLSPGGIERAVPASATVRDESVALCVAREASHLPLASSAGPAQAKMEVTLSTGDEPVIVPPPAPHADQVREALRASWPAVERCYASELAKHPDLGGRLELRFRARGTGEVVEVAEEGESRFADVDVTRCVLGVYRSARLPAGRARSSRETSFAYAMHLEAAQNTSPAAK